MNQQEILDKLEDLLHHNDDGSIDMNEFIPPIEILELINELKHESNTPQ